MNSSFKACLRHAVYSRRTKRDAKFWPTARLFFRNVFRGDGVCVRLVVCFHRSGKWAMQRGNRGLITWFLCVVCRRPADRPQRGGRGQPGGDSRICQSIQDPPAIPGPDTDPGGPGAERCRGAGVQPVCHLQVRANTKAKKVHYFGSIRPNSVKRKQQPDWVVCRSSIFDPLF